MIFLNNTKYQFAGIEETLDSQLHSEENKILQISEIMKNHEKILYGILVCYPKIEFKIEPKPDVIPYHFDRPYILPHYVKDVFKKELGWQI